MCIRDSIPSEYADLAVCGSFFHGRCGDEHECWRVKIQGSEEARGICQRQRQFGPHLKDAYNEGQALKALTDALRWDSRGWDGR